MVNKYYKQELFISHDGGETWTSVGAFQKGALIEKDSPDCVYVPPTPPIYRWVKTQCTICVEDSTPLSGQYLTFIASDDITVTFTPQNSNVLYYSKDNGTTWTEGNSIEVFAGEEVFLKGTMTPSYLHGIGKFSSNGTFEALGNPMSLLFGDNFSGQTSLNGKDDAFGTLFSGCTYLESIENLVLPATTLAERCYVNMFRGCSSLTSIPSGFLPSTTLAEGCYYGMFQSCTSLASVPSGLLLTTTLSSNCYANMFYNCSSLTTAPQLPATTLADWCYRHMFYNCTSLTTAPSLPATTLEQQCYYGMFHNCTSLTTAPVLPATTLADWCYYEMFHNCTSLTTAPELPATSLQSYCYEYMFYNCTSLNYIKCLATDISASNCTYNWVNGVASSGTFIRDCNTQWPTGDSGIPSGWTDNCSSPQPSYSGQYLTFVAQESGTFKFLKSTGNTTDIQYSLDSGSTWTTLASDTNSPTVESGHTIMWKGTLTPIAYYDWHYPCGVGKFSSSGRFIAEGNAMSLLYGNNFVGQTSLNGKSYAFATLFSGATTLTSAENLILPATTLSSNCYGQMFLDCTSLTTAPQLPAATLVDWCYCYMFEGCSSLNYIKCLATNISASECTRDWVNGVTSSGQFWIPQAAISPSLIWSWGDSGIPTTWSWFNIDAYS